MEPKIMEELKSKFPEARIVYTEDFNEIFIKVDTKDIESIDGLKFSEVYMVRFCGLVGSTLTVAIDLDMEV